VFGFATPAAGLELMTPLLLLLLLLDNSIMWRIS